MPANPASPTLVQSGGDSSSGGVPVFYYGWGWWWWWLGLGLLILLALWWFFVWGPWRRRPRGPGGGYGPDQENLEGRDRALQILDERYARGEITREQYEEMRRDLENRNAA